MSFNDLIKSTRYYQRMQDFKRNTVGTMRSNKETPASPLTHKMSQQEWRDMGMDAPPEDIAEKTAMHQASAPWWTYRTLQQTPEERKARLDHYLEQFTDTVMKMDREERL